MKKYLLVLMLLVAVCAIVSCTPKHEHSISSELIVVKEATCMEDGISHMFCTECGEIVSIVAIPKTNEHKEVVIPAIEATCKSTGLTEGIKCSVCDKIILAQTEVPLKAHTEEIISAVASTCTENGLTEGKKCSACGDILVPQQEAPLKAHDYDNNEDATCNSCGYERYCVHHNTEALAAVEPTCTATGLTEGTKCSDCGEVIVAQEVIGLTAHTEVIDNAVDPTCNKTGLTEGKHCSACGEVLMAQTLINIVDHDFVDVNCSYCGISFLAYLREELTALSYRNKEISNMLYGVYDLMCDDDFCNCCMVDGCITDTQTYSRMISEFLSRIEEYERSGNFDVEQMEDLKSEIKYRFSSIEDDFSEATELCTKLENGEFVHG